MSMRLKPYPSYKESKVEWLGRIPEHWNIKPLKVFFEFEKGRKAQELTAEYICDHPGDYPVYSGQTDDAGVMGRISSFEYDEPAVIFTTTVGARVMTPLVLRGQFSLSQNCLIMRPRNGNVSVLFVFYQLHPLFAFERGAIPSYMQPSLRIADLNQFAIGCPPVAEQESIASFLDRETGRIDTLVKKKERLIELLQEKRTALISHAVTQGLNPNVPKKDSGIPWLGRIPEHWLSLPFKRFVESMCDGPFGSDMKSSHYSDTGIRLIRLQNIGVGYFDNADQAFIPESHFRSLSGHDALPGDLLVAGLGDPNNPVGRACLLPHMVPIAMVKADCFRVRLNQKQLTHPFVAHFLCSSAARAAAQDQTRGATRERMNLTGLSQITVAVPPLAEQDTIVKHINQETFKLDALMAKALRAIELLREYRTGLISAAVTGQIDVRSEGA